MSMVTVDESPESCDMPPHRTVSKPKRTGVEADTPSNRNDPRLRYGVSGSACARVGPRNWWGTRHADVTMKHVTSDAPVAEKRPRTAPSNKNQGDKIKYLRVFPPPLAHGPAHALGTGGVGRHPGFRDRK